MPSRSWADTSAGPSLGSYATALSAILALFVLRVLAQALIAVGYDAFLPPWEEWFSGFVPYPQLLASQIAILLVCGKVCLDFIRRRGFFVTPRRWLGSLLLSLGSLYFGVMAIRYAIRMSLYPLERWTGGSIPIFFHGVLAAFMLRDGCERVARRAGVAARSRSGYRVVPSRPWPCEHSGR